ncbi:alanine racemase [Antarcticibacterium arcticum]|uniref:Alanine racemase n=1 Tax=Antarcticibacterium arcticum TaxID=2585771 RepID=A0A5B8YK51_9FLAO|nr:alanine racemase [Antarcticibacterium arcticum]QED38400.1 alanine racemase [Antarcticibacterium arcticum]
MQKTRETVLEIDLGALAHNYRYLREKAGKGVKFLGVVKAFAYGNDEVVIAKKLSALGVDYFGVAYTSEGVSLRKAGIEKPVLILHPQSFNFEEIIENCLEPSIYSEFVLKEFIKTAERLGQKDYPVHIKLNTGLNRLGFSEPEISKVLEHLSNTTAIRIKGLYSHLAASEDWKEREFTLGQINRFRKMAFEIVNAIGYHPLLHITNTSGIVNYPEAAFDMVRAGLGLYGFGNDPEIDKHLKPIGTLKTIVSQIMKLQPGDTVGYNRAYKAQEEITIATLPLGYADGISRQLGNERSGVYINGYFAPLIGNVCMDMIMVNISGIACEEGDEVIVFGKEQPVTEFAKQAGTISYELIAGISQRVKRVYLPE